MSTRIFYVDSRNNVGTAGNFVYKLNRTLVAPQGASFRIDKWNCPMTFNLVNSNNQNLYWLDGGSVYRSAQITRGNYDSIGLAAALQAAFASSAGSSAVSVAYNGATGATTFTTVAYGWHLFTDAEIATLGAHYTSVDVSAPKSFNGVLSYPGGGVTITNFPTAPVYTFGFISMQPYPAIYLSSSRLSSCNIQGPSGSSTPICVMNCAGLFGTPSFGENPETVWQPLGPLVVDAIDFQICDASGSPINVIAGYTCFQLSVQGLDSS